MHFVGFNYKSISRSTVLRMSNLISSWTGEHPKPCSLQLQYLIEHENLLCADIGYINVAVLVRCGPGS
jgi:hypothetical protein